MKCKCGKDINTTISLKRDKKQICVECFKYETRVKEFEDKYYSK